VQQMLQWKSNNYYILCVFVALVIHHAMRMRRVVIYVLSVATVFSTLSHKWQDFKKKKVTGHKMFALVFSTNFV